MQILVLKSKIHRATVTEACLDYEGSLTIDTTLMQAANIYPYEKVEIYNLANGSRFETYAIPGKADSGIICANGAAAHLAKAGELIIIAAYGIIPDTPENRTKYQPQIVKVDQDNRIKK
ncbi:MAG: aspartate 1-decarboxylase [Candidatus Schekmanbacteria bacterium]|nr:aspartate 1-decarboxylase [Candidatus Schekmanbacteria bacterium]